MTDSREPAKRKDPADPINQPAGEPEDLRSASNSIDYAAEDARNIGRIRAGILEGSWLRRPRV
jgi:hypothetical protein